MTEEVTDEALDAAAETVAADTVQASDEVVPEEGTDAPEGVTDDNVDVVPTDDVDNIDVVEPEIPEEPEEHGERSALGRKVGDNYRELTNELEQMKRELDSFKQGVQSVQPQQPAEPMYNDDEMIPETMGDLNKWYENRVQHDRQLQDADATRYESGYRNTFSELAKELDTDEAKKIEDEMLANYNVRHSNDPQLDAERNFLRAENAILRNKPPEKPQTNLRQGKPTGGASGTSTAQRKAAVVKLDPVAAEFVNELKKSGGWTDDDVAKALEGDMPLNLSQGNITG